MTEATSRNPILVNLFRQNRWANLATIDACAAVAAARLDAEAPGTVGTIRDTLWHVVDAENHFLAALHGHPNAEGIALLAGAESGDLATLRAHAARIGDELVAWAATIEGDPMLTGEWEDGPYHVPASMFAAQALLHGREHRVQIGEALERAGMEGPDVDAWSWWEAVSEGREEG